jgi:chromosome segregation ATPase
MELDRISKHVLVKLAQLDEATATELKEALGLDQNQSIHYRMDQKLIPQDLAREHPERREQPGSRKAARVYQITSSGEEWVNEHRHEVTLSDLDAAEQEIQRLTSELHKVSSDLQSLKKWRQEQSGQTGGMSTQLSDIGDRVGDLEEQMVKHNRRDYSGIWDRLHDLDERADRLAKNLPDDPATDDDVRRVRQDLDNRADELESRIDNIAASQSEFSDWSHSTDKRVQQLEQHTEQGILGRLRWLLFG